MLVNLRHIPLLAPFTPVRHVIYKSQLKSHLMSSYGTILIGAFLSSRIWKIVPALLFTISCATCIDICEWIHTDVGKLQMKSHCPATFKLCWSRWVSQVKHLNNIFNSSFKRSTPVISYCFQVLQQAAALLHSAHKRLAARHGYHSENVVCL